MHLMGWISFTAIFGTFYKGVVVPSDGLFV